MRITWYSHSCFLVEEGPHRLLFDPWLTDNPRAPLAAADVRCTHILCSHAHDDHSKDVIEIAKNCGATIIAPFELAEYFSALGLDTIDPMQGGTVPLPFGQVQLTQAIHSSSRELPEGENAAMGIAAGFVVTLGKRRLYFAGDTALFSDMRLIGRKTLDVAFLPIGDWYTMGTEDALVALDYLCPSVTLPMHFNTSEKILADPQAFARRAAEAGHRVSVLEVNQSLEI
jgi:L-ascorbate metabolism protein UlaG (beta-lactamase superfamily)